MNASAQEFTPQVIKKNNYKDYLQNTFNPYTPDQTVHIGNTTLNTNLTSEKKNYERGPYSQSKIPTSNKKQNNYRPFINNESTLHDDSLSNQSYTQNLNSLMNSIKKQDKTLSTMRSSFKTPKSGNLKVDTKYVSLRKPNVRWNEMPK